MQSQGVNNYGTIAVLPTGLASTLGGSQGGRVEWTAGVYDSATKTAISPWLGWEAVPTGNNSASPSVRLNFEYGPGTNEDIHQTGLGINHNGTIEFASGQTFPKTVSTSESMYEGFGSGKLENGAVTILLDADFLAEASTDVPYHVYLTPNGDTHGLYVTNKKPGSFEVHESGGGTSSVEFDYRIVARRKG